MNPDPKLLAERQAKIDALGPCPPWWRFLGRRRWRRAYATIMAIDVSFAAAMYRQIYSDAALEEIANRPSPFSAFMKERK